jgi:predicted acetyltransferase
MLQSSAYTVRNSAAGAVMLDTAENGNVPGPGVLRAAMAAGTVRHASGDGSCAGDHRNLLTRVDSFDRLVKMGSGDISNVSVEIVPATVEQKPVLANLLELYSHDFCEFIDLEIGPDGRFGYRDLDLYWTEAGRLPFLLYVNNRLAGFALIKATRPNGLDETEWDMVEFFILRGYRGRGIGTEIAHQVWRLFPGHWTVRVMAINKPAYRFWCHAIESFAVGGQIFETGYQQGGKDWRRFSFES